MLIFSYRILRKHFNVNKQMEYFRNLRDVIYEWPPYFCRHENWIKKQFLWKKEDLFS